MIAKSIFVVKEYFATIKALNSSQAKEFKSLTIVLFWLLFGSNFV
jgi:hypothetical protein